MAFARMGETDRAWELFRPVNSVQHALTPEQTGIYKLEPYVVAADVYSMPPNTGRGGWSWYTGSASWMYRLLMETLLGINRTGNALHLSPRLPKEWDSYKVHYRFGQSMYHITFIRLIDGSKPRLTLDGSDLNEFDNAIA